MPLLTTTMIGKIAFTLIGKYGAEKIKKFYEDNRSDYQKELTAVIERSIIVFSNNFNTKDLNGKYSFTKSKVVIESLLKFSLSHDFNHENLFGIIKQERNVYTPTLDELIFFIEAFENEIAQSHSLKDFHIRDNFQEEIFLISDKLNTLVDLSEKIKNDTQEIKEGMAVFQTLKQGLSQNFHNQIEEIRKCAERFQVDTALNLIEALEKELDNQDFHEAIIRSKLLFLKAYCLKEVNKEKTLDFSKIFVQAYLKNSNDLNIKRQATVAYFNLNEKNDALKVANEILIQEQFDLTAWVIKSISSDNLEEFLLTVPEIVKKSNAFQNSIAYYVMRRDKCLNIEYLDDLNIILKVDKKLFPELTLFTKDIWNVNIELIYNLESKSRIRNYVIGEDFLFDKNEYTEHLIKILKDYITKLDKTEIADRILDYKFILSFYLYATTNDPSYCNELEKLSPLIKEDSNKLTRYCQVLNHQKRYEDSIKAFDNFKENSKDFPLDVLIFQINTLIFSGKEGAALQELKSYINSIPSIDHNRIHNLKGIIFSLLNKISEESIAAIISLILEKAFSNATLKALIKIEFSLALDAIEQPDKNLTVQQLGDLTKEVTQENLHLFLHCYLLLGEFKKALELCRIEIAEFENSTEESLKLYVYVLLESINYKNPNEEIEYDLHPILLKLLEYFRKEVKPINYPLLKRELELFKAIEDWPTILEITSLLYKVDPSDEYTIVNYLIALKENQKNEELEKISSEIPVKFSSEIHGINAAKTLTNSKINPKKALQIVFTLALDSKNIQSRLYFFNVALFNRDYLESYDSVKANTYVEFVVNEESYIEYIEKDHHWIGKEIGAKLTEQENFTNNITSITILNCFNKYVKLYKEILKESRNPLNRLGIRQFNFDGSSKESMEKQLKELFGFQGEEEENYQKKILDDYFSYNTGFINLTISLFNQDFWTTAKFLQTNHTYNIIPKVFFGNPFINDETRFILDFTSLCTLYDAHKKFGLQNLKNKFLISNQIPPLIDNLIEEEKSSPTSFRLKITTKDVIPNFQSEDYSNKKIKDLQGLKDWVEEYCEKTIVKEKIDFVFKLPTQKLNPLTRSLVDNVLLSNRKNHILISDDVFYSLNSKKVRIISSEIYLLHIFEKNMHNKIYHHFLENNFVGITVDHQVLLESFLNYLAGKDNNYLIALRSLSQKFNPSSNKISEISSFIKDIYLISALPLESKNSHVHNLLLAIFPGSTPIFRNSLLEHIKQSMKLTGAMYDEIISTFQVAQKQFYS